MQQVSPKHVRHDLRGIRTDVPSSILSRDRVAKIVEILAAVAKRLLVVRSRHRRRLSRCHRHTAADEPLTSSCKR